MWMKEEIKMTQRLLSSTSLDGDAMEMGNPEWKMINSVMDVINLRFLWNIHMKDEYMNLELGGKIQIGKIQIGKLSAPR